MATKYDYTKLDAAILKSLNESNPVLFTGLYQGKVRAAAEALEDQARGHTKSKRDEKPSWRFVDGRLQALRKAGKVKYQRKPEGWVLVKAEA
ncbi:MAG TPA: hypothetical protein VGF12_07145 [Roseateles sp.]|uniref:hypothetical protein n=1 Tax=Roseateles sp. TaxID=1971397 RepID=UPI002ED88CB3